MEDTYRANKRFTIIRGYFGSGLMAFLLFLSNVGELASFLAVHQVVFQGFFVQSSPLIIQTGWPVLPNRILRHQKKEEVCWSWTGWPVLPNRMLRHQKKKKIFVGVRLGSVQVLIVGHVALDF